jgi:hypothetical protein
MNVAELEQYFVSLAKLLQATDAKKTAAELSRIAEGLQSFRGYALADFAGFLVRAEEYHRTGVLPVVAGKAGARSKAEPKPKADLSAVRSDVERQYRSASSPNVTIESIEALRPKLNALTKADLVSIAEAIDLTGMSSKTKALIVDAIVSRVLGIKQSVIRTSVIDRPGARY